MNFDKLKPGPWEKIHNALGVKIPNTDPRSISAHVECHANSIPQAIALTYFDKDISYSDLNLLANQLSNALGALGVSKGDVIGVLLPNIPQYVITLLAASKIGATISGISAMLAPMEMVQQIEDAEVKILFLLDDLADTKLPAMKNLPDSLLNIIVTSTEDFLHPKQVALPSVGDVKCHTFWDLISSENSEFEQIDFPPEDVAFIQYTGGTTGPAKGARLTAGGTTLNAELSQIYRPWDIGKETVASALPMFHIAGIILLTISLRYAGRFMLIPNPRDIDHFCDQMIKHPPTRIGSVPTLYQQIVQNPLSSKIDFSSLAFAMTGSAPITGSERKRVEKLLNGIVLSDSYGMTETGPAIAANPPDRCKPDSVGLPLPGIDIRIVDLETGTKELPFGEVGEIIVSTPCIMAGYLNRPEETANAIREWCGKSWMYSGDVGVMDEEGYIYLRDRTKDVINVSGFKVFSTEVEGKLTSLDCIANAALIGSPDPARPGSEIVNLYVELSAIAKDKHPEDVKKEIRDFSDKNLARYKIPKTIYFLDALPLTAVGKVDKKRLRTNAFSSAII